MTTLAAPTGCLITVWLVAAACMTAVLYRHERTAIQAKGYGFWKVIAVAFVMWPAAIGVTVASRFGR